MRSMAIAIEIHFNLNKCEEFDGILLFIISGDIKSIHASCCCCRCWQVQRITNATGVRGKKHKITLDLKNLFATHSIAPPKQIALWMKMRCLCRKMPFLHNSHSLTSIICWLRRTRKMISLPRQLLLKVEKLFSFLMGEANGIVKCRM